jgi:hypothetical protein
MDFFVFKNINFTDPENLLFLAIVFILGIIFLSTLFFILAKVGRAIRGLFSNLFNIEARRPNFAQPAGGDRTDREPRENKNLTGSPAEKNISRSAAINFSSSDKKPEEEVRDAKKSYAEKEEKGIAESLSKLKVGNGEDKQTLESKMPPRLENQEDNSNQTIKIPRSRRFPASSAQPLGLTGARDERDAQFNVNGSGKSEGPAQGFSGPSSGTQDYTKKSVSVQPGNKVSAQKKEAIRGLSQGADSSIFNGEPEISRIKLEHEMRLDPKVWQAERQAGLALSPVERAKLVKEVFSSALVRNISKTDLKWSIKKLNKKMIGTKDEQEHAKIRKEIKFFKKIGGIKN